MKWKKGTVWAKAKKAGINDSQTKPLCKCEADVSDSEG